MLEILGFRHITKIQKYFWEQKIFSRTGNAYHSVVISEVFNGRKANPTIEAGILKFVSVYPDMLKEEEAKKNEIIANAKKQIDAQS